MKKLLFLALAVAGMGVTSCEKKQPNNDMKKKTQDVTNDKITKDINKMEKTASGLGYKILVAAADTAVSPKAGQQVEVHYTGYLAGADGEPDLKQKFDSSLDRGQKFKFVIGRGMVIRGWDEGVMLMKVGEQRRLYIPSDLGYGPRGIPGVIPGGATLIFDVELFGCK